MSVVKYATLFLFQLVLGYQEKKPKVSASAMDLQFTVVALELEINFWNVSLQLYVT